jgi:hypothetical protein
LLLIAAIVSLTVLIFLVFCIPLYMSFQMDTDRSPKWRISLLWFFGLVSKEVGKREKLREKSETAERRPKRKKKGLQAKTILKILRTKGLLRRLRHLLTDTMSCLKIKELGANFRIGFDDPADTGMLFALIGPAILFLNLASRHPIRVTPSFEDETVFKGYFHGTLRLRPIQLIPPLVRFGFSLPAIKALKLLALRKW